MRSMKDAFILEPEIVSLIIPCYNGENCLSACLDSVINQDYSDKIELIFINDGSTDRTEEVFQEIKPALVKKLHRVIYLYQENMGVGFATQTALQFVSGEYLSLLDADDCLFPESVSSKVQLLKVHPEVSCVYSNGLYSYDGKKEDMFYSEPLSIDETGFFDSLIDGGAFSWAGSYMIRFSTWLKRCPDRKIYPSRGGQNLQIILPAVYKEKAIYIDKPLMQYNVHEQSLSSVRNGNDGRKNFEMTYRFEDIYINIIESICEEDKEFYLLKIQRSSIRTRMGIAKKYKNAELMKTVKKEYSSVGGMTINDRITINSICNPPWSFFLRFIRKASSIWPKRADQNIQ